MVEFAQAFPDASIESTLSTQLNCQSQAVEPTEEEQER
jgi:hypothetical protein